MADRPKRSISLPADLDAAMEQAARLQGVSVSGWIAETIAHRLALEAGWQEVEAWEADHGRLTAAELAEGRARAAASLAEAARLAAERKARQERDAS
jgi:regulator of protease activity HflC (stomatin/prohibitin superfamily)